MTLAGDVHQVAGQHEMLHSHDATTNKVFAYAKSLPNWQTPAARDAVLQPFNQYLFPRANTDVVPMPTT